MEKNKKMLLFCAFQIGIYLLFLGFLLIYLKVHRSQIQSSALMLLWITMIFLVLVGCAITLAIVDYMRGMVNYASVDVVGVHNKKALEKKLQELQEKDDTFDLGIMMFDLNNLKKVNDNYGHEEGDLFIQTFASYLARILTENSFLARYGGDEFVIVEEHTTLQQLDQMNHKLQEYMDEYNVSATHKISYAVGYEVSYRNHYYLVPDLMKIADEKMYEDKRYKKRNQAQNLSDTDRTPFFYPSNTTPSISAKSLAEKIYTTITNNEHGSYVFLMTDIKDFHLINDYWGYDVGNQILDTVLKSITNCPEVNFAKRFHSDVFVVLADAGKLSKQAFEDLIKQYNHQIEQQILDKFSVSYFMLRTGIYFIDDPSANLEEIISRTNTARRMARDKVSGIVTYGDQIRQLEQHRADILNSFQHALDTDEICIYFQPKIGGKSEKIESAEVLVRWQRDDGTVWAPDQFLPILEETGEIIELDYFVYKKAFIWLNERQTKQLPLVPISLNVSPVHFYNLRAFEEKLHELTETYHPDPSLLVFEITESAYIHNIDAVNHMIEKCHAAGIRISMDDFGSGYSSLNTLKDILFDEIKMDKHFLEEGLTTNSKIVIEEIFHLLKRAKHSIVCEGIETKEVADFLIAAGCDELQGYYYYRPMDQPSFEQLLERVSMV